jgi:hypothetical protein
MRDGYYDEAKKALDQRNTERAAREAAERALADARFVLQRIANCTTGDVQTMADDALAGRLQSGEASTPAAGEVIRDEVRDGK